MNIRFIAARSHSWHGKRHPVSAYMFPVVPSEIREDVRQMFMDVQSKLYTPTLDPENLMEGVYSEEDESIDPRSYGDKTDRNAAPEERQAPGQIRRRYFPGVPHKVDLKALTPEVQKVLGVTSKQRKTGKFDTGTFDIVKRIADTKYQVSNTRMDVPPWLYQPNLLLLLLYRYPGLPRQFKEWAHIWEKIERYWVRKEPFENYGGKKHPDAMVMSRLRQTGYKMFYELIPEVPEYIEEGNPAGQSIWVLTRDTANSLARKVLTPDEIGMVEEDARAFCLHGEENGRKAKAEGRTLVFHTTLEDVPAHLPHFTSEFIVQKFNLWSKENLGLSMTPPPSGLYLYE
jgi:hypothetical protein